MSIKSDNWIRRMAADARMIEPFEPGQVRQNGVGRIVSYGTSSYGYDVRCANEFKIFTNINSTIVDPKRFDEKSFVDVTADVCIIPPNSFALARTVEYFRIPRSVLVVCLGKCVTADTRVVDAETGAYVPITEMRWGKSTLAMDNWRLGPAKVSAFLPQGKRAVYELRTRSGLRIKATANHPFRLPEKWVPLADLRAGDRIAVARAIPVFGKTPVPDWEATLLGLMLSEGECSSPDHGPTSTRADSAWARLLHCALAASPLGAVSFEGRDGERLVAGSARGGLTAHPRAQEWLERYGLNIGAADRVVPQAVFTAPEPSVRLFLQALFTGDGSVSRSGDGVVLEYHSSSRRRIEEVRHLLLRFGVFAPIRERTGALGTRAWQLQITNKAQLTRFAQRIGFCPGSSQQRTLLDESVPMIAQSARQFDTLPKEAAGRISAAREGGGSQGSLHASDHARHYVSTSAAHRLVLARGDRDVTALPEGPVWDAVESIEPAGEEEVFDISVPGPQNFVANDVIVHNSTYARCGIIVNVTPLEPEWEGHVTLEFSNTTPLPAKIYANEGVAQMLFFESDEVCSTSYADRGGKYQGQQGVTLPKA